MPLVATVTPRLVLVGFVPGVTVAVSNVVPPAATVFGDAPPVAVGLVDRGGPATALIVPYCVGVMPTTCSSVSASREIYAWSVPVATALGRCVWRAVTFVPVRTLL